MSELKTVIENSKVTVLKIKNDIESVFLVDIVKYPFLKDWIGKTIGDTVVSRKGEECVILNIVKEEIPPSPPTAQTSTDEELKKVLRLLENNNIIGRDISNSFEVGFSMADGLMYKKIYGTKALSIYDKGIDYLGFNYYKRGSFAQQKLLYAQDCTKEGFAVWMIPNSDLNGKSNGCWANFIDLNNNEIIQYSFVKDSFTHTPNEKRVVFVKQKSGEYVFIGIYQLKESIKNYFDGKCESKEIYSLINKDYPL